LNKEPKNILPLTTIKDDKEYKAVNGNEKGI